MKSMSLVLALCATAAIAPAQALLECQTPGPFPAHAGPADCEGLTGVSATVVTTGTCLGMPTEGVQFATVAAELNLSNVAGSTIARPVGAGAGEVRIPLFVGANNVTLDYLYQNGDTGFSTQWVDGFDISVCDAAGNRLALLARGDNSTFALGCAGIVNLNASFPAAVAGDYLSLVCHNGGDNTTDSFLHFDNVFVTGAPVFTLAFSTPAGPGSVQMDITNGPAFSAYFAAIALAPGNFPNGSFYGVDISLFDILTELQAGAPFVGALDATGSYSTGPLLGAPSGLTLYAVAIDNLFSPSPNASAPVAHTIL